MQYDTNNLSRAEQANILTILNENRASPIDVREGYKDLLRGCYGDKWGNITVCGLEYDAADALETLDPVAFRCGEADYYSSLIDGGAIEIMGDLYDEDQVEYAIEALLESESIDLLEWSSDDSDELIGNQGALATA